MKKLVLLLSITTFLVSCNQNSASGDAAEKNATSENVGASGAIENLPEFSIYHLPSTWTTQHGKSLELKELHGKVLVMVMIYTSCDFSCPQLVEDMKAIEASLAKDQLEDTQLIMVSIDPETDTPQRLKEFAIENDMEEDHWLLLRGTPTATQEFAAVLSVKYTRISPIDFAHSNIISVFDKEGVLVYQREGLGRDAKIHEVLEEHI